MATVTKGDIVNVALRKATIASVAMLFQPDPAAVQTALEDLESMIALWQKDNLDVGYIIADNGQPNPDDDSGVDLAYKMPIALQLARQILIDNSRTVPSELNLQANSMMDMLRSTFYVTPSLKQRNDMPTGAGNLPFWPAGRFYYDGTNK